LHFSVAFPNLYERERKIKSWLGKSEQGGKRSFCLTAAKMAA
jgi:hypothetical protein